MTRVLRNLAAEYALGVCVLSAFAGCAAHDPAGPPSDSGSYEPLLLQSPAETAGRCRAFADSLAELAACQRADGTMRTFGEARIAWRVRYFFRYWEMPCGEVPTRDESYVFGLAARDLYGDGDLTDPQRRAIRDAMFEGRVRCR